MTRLLGSGRGRRSHLRARGKILTARPPSCVPRARQMRKSHNADHARLLQEIDDAAAAVGGDGAALLPVAVVDKILRGFEQHAGRYDAAYASRLSAALAAAA